MSKWSFLKLSKVLFLSIIVISIASCSFSRDNAASLAYDLEDAAEKLKTQDIGAEQPINFKPKDKQSPFVILITTERGVTKDELIAKGLDATIVNDLYSKLNYINLRNSATIVVFQNGEISFTTYYRRFVEVDATQIIESKGNTEIIVKTKGVTKGHLTDEVLLIDLI